jgi:transcriptional regulator with XRE-family HTH domain
VSAFKDRLKDLRKSLNLNQGELAEKLELSRSAVSSYERGIREPDFDTLEKIADFFNVDKGYLLGEAEIRRRFIFTERSGYEFEKIIHDLMMTNSLELVEILSKLNKMNDDELHTLNKMLK